MIDELSTSEARRFFVEHQHDDPAKLVLSAKKWPDIPVQLIAHQVKCYQKAKKKLPELAANSQVIYPPGVSLEQSSSEITAKYKAQLIGGNVLTDLTGGFGIDAFYLSRQFNRINIVEKNEALLPIVKHNFRVLGVSHVSFYFSSAEHFLDQEENPADWYYLDPARRDEQNLKVFKVEDCQPDLTQIIPSLVERKASILCKMSPMLDLHQLLNISGLYEIHVVSVDNECKELLFLLKNESTKTLRVKTINLTKKQEERFDFTYAEEEEACEFSLPLSYIYEPNASIMKAGAFVSVANRYEVFKLHRNSHLYTSDQLVDDFPGRIFKLEAITVANRKKMKVFLPDNQANLTVRNYPISVQEIRKKTTLKEGGNKYLFATTLVDGSPKLLVCNKV